MGLESQLKSTVGLKNNNPTTTESRPKSVEIKKSLRWKESREPLNLDATTGQIIVAKNKLPFKDRFKAKETADLFETSLAFLAESSNPVFTVYSLTKDQL